MSNIAQLTKAYYFAAEKHKKQRRKGEAREPYINHPAMVADILAQSGADIDTIIVGVLHDTVEDTKTSYEELIQEFGVKIADTVMEVTDDKNLPKAKCKQLQIDRMPEKSKAAKKVKLADKISNLESMMVSPPAGWNYDRKMEYFEWSRAVIDGGRGTCDILEKQFDEVYSRGVEFLKGQIS